MMKSKTRLPALFALALPLAGACGDVEKPDEGADAATEDTTPPTILSTTPEDGATGQFADVEVVIVFSEKMDRVAVEAALDAESLGPVGLTWNEALDTLTIRPESPLAYAEGTASPDEIEANAYSVVLGKEAADFAGNELGTDVEIEFTTFKLMNMNFTAVPAWSRTIIPSEIVEELDTDAPFYVGDISADIGLRSVLTFDLSVLPGSTHSIESATFATLHLAGEVAGTPFSDLSPVVVLDHVTYPELLDENAVNAAYNSDQTALSPPLDLFEDGQTTVLLDVTAAVADDFEHLMDRGYRSQFLARFDTITNEDGAADNVQFSRERLELRIDYLHP